MDSRFETPAFLQPHENFQSLAPFESLPIWPIIEDFAKGFQIENEIALTSVLAALSQAIGGSIRTSTTFASVESPFSLLLVTPESRPVWAHVPIRFLTSEFETQAKQMLFNYQHQKQNGGEKENSNPPSAEFRLKADLGEEMFVSATVERIAIPSVRFPFPKSLIDNHVLLTTPPPGLRRAFKSLTNQELFSLETALCTNQRLVNSNGIGASGVPSFYWQITRNEIGNFLRENPWMISCPFLVIDSKFEGIPVVDISRGCIPALSQLCRELIGKRYKTMGRGILIETKGDAFSCIHEFLKKAQSWETNVADERRIAILPIADLAFKFSMIFATLERCKTPSATHVLHGLELAKRLTIRHYETLAKHLSSDINSRLPDLADLPDRHRDVYQKIRATPGMTPSQLSRSFNRMLKGERNSILDELERRHLIDSSRKHLEPASSGSK